MKALRIAGALVLLSAHQAPGLAQSTAAFRAVDVLTQAHHIQAAIIPLEQASQVLAGNPTAQDVGTALDGFEQTCRDVAATWKEKNVPVSLDSSLAVVRDGRLLEHARASLEKSDLPAASAATRDAYDAVLSVAYSALAENYSAVAEQGGETWSFSGLIELAGVRLKQREFGQAKEALWKAYAATSQLADAEMDPVRKAFDTLVERIGRGLIGRGEWQVAREHLEKTIAAPELQKTEFVHAALGMCCFELADTDCAVEYLTKAAAAGTGNTARDVFNRGQRLLKEAEEDPASYAKLFQLVEVWRKIAPEDDEILRIPVAAARQDAAGMQQRMQQTTDCELKALLVQVLQQSAPAETYLADAQAALACDAENPTAKSVVATANYRLAVQAWNELAQRPPSGLAAATPKLEELKALLAQADGDPNAAELGRKVADYEGALLDKDRKLAEARRQQSAEQCASMLARARWARDESRVGISDLAEIVERTHEKSEGCAAHLDEADRNELAAIQPKLAERLQKACEAEYYRLPDLPSDPSALRRDQVDGLRAQIEAYQRACEPYIANSFRGERVASLMERLDASRANP